jgi:hypothetical protein
LSLLHGVTIHCLPHGQVFTDPVIVNIDLPPELTSRSAACRLSIYYSGTDVSEVPRWKKFIGPTCSSAGDVRFAENSSQFQLSNSGVVLVNEAKLALVLHHFCIFAVVIDGREEKVRKASVGAFMKICDSLNWMAVDVLILVGCNEQDVVSTKYMIHVIVFIQQNYYLRYDIIFQPLEKRCIRLLVSLFVRQDGTQMGRECIACEWLIY